MKRLFRSRPVIAWALYDWANSAFATTVIAGFFPVFYSCAERRFIGARFAVLVQHRPRRIQHHHRNRRAVIGRNRRPRRRAQKIPRRLRPARHPRRRRLGMGFRRHVGGRFIAIRCRQCRLLRRQYFLRFHDHVEVADEPQYDFVSAYGYALGYIGGGILFALNVLMVTQPQWFGFTDTGSALSAAFISVAVWWGVFTVPLLCWVKESQPQQKIRGALCGYRRHQTTRCNLPRVASNARFVFIFNRLLVLH